MKPDGNIKDTDLWLVDVVFIGALQSYNVERREGDKVTRLGTVWLPVGERWWTGIRENAERIGEWPSKEMAALAL